MTVLLDEQLAVDLRHEFGPEFEVETTEYRGWKGIKNGELLKRAEAHFEVFVTNDQSVIHQQDLRASRLRFVVLDAPSNKLSDLKPLIPEAEEALREMEPGEIRYVGRST